jgi:hypothetical protein
MITLQRCDICGKWFVPEVVKNVPVLDPNVRIARKDSDRLSVCLACYKERILASRELGWDNGKE